MENLTKSLSDNVSRLSKEVSSLKENLRDSNFRPSLKEYNRNNSQSHFRSHSRKRLCRFHNKFGANAKKFEKPCYFTSHASKKTKITHRCGDKWW